ncbi:MAG: hypothetical protein WAX57_04230, partial [Minisyncoccia bacterium]
MQVGRWNHQSSGGNSHGSSRPSGPSRGSHGSEQRSYSSRPPQRSGSGSSYRPSGGRSGGYGGGNRGRAPARGRGFGSFGETEAEISKFMNKTVVTTEEPVFVPEHKFADFDINAHLKKNIESHGYEL